MSEGAVALREESPPAEVHEFPEDLGPAIAENTKLIKHLQLTLTKLDSDVQRALEEQKLMHELQTLDQLMLMKVDKETNRKNRMPINPDSLQRIIELKDAIKLQSQQEMQLKHEEELLVSDDKMVEETAARLRAAIQTAQDSTGYTGRGGRPYEALDNAERRHQIELAELEEEQRTIKGIMSKLTAQIEDLTAQLDSLKTLDDDFAQANEHHMNIREELEANRDALASLKRILAKKEKLLADLDRKDPMKDLKLLEGDKRVAHTELTRANEQLRVNERAILAQDERIRKLEARLAGFDAILPHLFQDMDNRGESIGRPPEVPQDATHVPANLFDDAVNELQLLRNTLADRDVRLENLDAAVEVLERKIDIVHAAQESQTAKAATEISDIDKERLRIEEHVLQISREFEQEKQRLASERKRWEAIRKA